MKKHWPMEAVVVVEEDGKIIEKLVKNINDDGTFAMDQVYAFPVNVELNGASKESVTVHRCLIPEGTQVEVGYKAVRSFIAHLGYEPSVICKALGFNELLEDTING